MPIEKRLMGMVLMNGTAVTKLAGVVGVVVLLAGCSSSQKPATLGTSGGSVGSSTASGTPSGGATSTIAPASASASSAAAPTSAAATTAAPTTVTTSTKGWGYTATVPGDPNGAAAMAAFQKYQSIVYTMETTVQHSNDLVNYADGNVLSLANNYVTTLRQSSLAMQGTTKINAAVTGTDMNAKPLPTVTVTACSDETKFNTFFTYGAKKGQQAGKAPTQPTVSVFVVHKSADGKWRVNSVTPQEGKTC